jgi:ribonuclease P protein component
MVSVFGCGHEQAAPLWPPAGAKAAKSSRPETGQPPVLPKNARMTRSADFRRTIRSGVRITRPTLVLHADRVPDNRVLVGVVVSKAIGNAVVRNRIKRRLRHLAAERIPTTPIGTDIVVRALPRSGTEPAGLRSDLPAAWASAVGRLAERGMT